MVGAAIVSVREEAEDTPAEEVLQPIIDTLVAHLECALAVMPESLRAPWLRMVAHRAVLLPQPHRVVAPRTPWQRTVVNLIRRPEPMVAAHEAANLMGVANTAEASPPSQMAQNERRSGIETSLLESIPPPMETVFLHEASSTSYTTHQGQPSAYRRHREKQNDISGRI
jgi:hypothetical protein